jgi:hypothetical protein
MPVAAQPLSEYTSRAARGKLEAQRNHGGQAILFQLSDESRSRETSEFVSNFVRDKIRARVRDPEPRDAVLPTYPLGVKLSRPPTARPCSAMTSRWRT